MSFHYVLWNSQNNLNDSLELFTDLNSYEILIMIWENKIIIQAVDKFRITMAERIFWNGTDYILHSDDPLLHMAQMSHLPQLSSLNTVNIMKPPVAKKNGNGSLLFQGIINLHDLLRLFNDSKSESSDLPRSPFVNQNSDLSIGTATPIDLFNRNKLQLSPYKSYNTSSPVSITKLINSPPLNSVSSNIGTRNTNGPQPNQGPQMTPISSSLRANKDEYRDDLHIHNNTTLSNNRICEDIGSSTKGHKNQQHFQVWKISRNSIFNYTGGLVFDDKEDLKKSSTIWSSIPILTKHFHYTDNVFNDQISLNEKPTKVPAPETHIRNDPDPRTSDQLGQLGQMRYIAGGIKGEHIFIDIDKMFDLQIINHPTNRSVSLSKRNGNEIQQHLLNLCAHSLCECYITIKDDCMELYSYVPSKKNALIYTYPFGIINSDTPTAINSTNQISSNSLIVETNGQTLLASNSTNVTNESITITNGPAPIINEMNGSNNVLSKKPKKQTKKLKSEKKEKKEDKHSTLSKFSLQWINFNLIGNHKIEERELTTSFSLIHITMFHRWFMISSRIEYLITTNSDSETILDPKTQTYKGPCTIGAKELVSEEKINNQTILILSFYQGLNNQERKMATLIMKKVVT